MKPAFLVVGVWLALVPLACARSVEDPFRTLGFDAACAAARSESKVVMLDFFTTWCVPCKKLDEVTWKDGSVRAWLAKKTVALRIDAEAEKALAERFVVEAYPSLVFVQPDGKIGRAHV